MTPIPLVFLPGLLNDARLWQAQIDGLQGLAQSIVGDLTGADNMAGLARNVLAKAPARFTLAGLSMGGYTALEIMRQAPERVIALALLDTSARPDTPQASEGRRDLMRRAETDFASVPPLLAPRMVHPDRLGDSGALFVEMALGAGKDTFLRQQQAIMSRIDSRPSLPRIACPTLILCGRDDVITPVEIHEEMAAAIPDSRLVVIEKCGHLSPLDQPERVTDAIGEWLKRSAE